MSAGAEGRFDRLEAEWAEAKAQVEASLEALSRREEIPPRLRESMLYSLRAGGKRLRPILCLAAGRRCGGDPERILPMAIAHEMFHTASLIHDDLPCMDDDSLRRGKPTNHVAYGEALALLAGDALLIWAFEHAARGSLDVGADPARALRALALFGEATGPAGVCGGQVLDTDPESASEERDFVAEIARTKTALLIRSALGTGALLAGAEESVAQRYMDYGTHLGLAFQIVDDVLDVVGDAKELGKTVGKDAAQGKRTFVSVYGLPEARRRAEEESRLAREILSPLLEEGDFLLDLPEYLVHRTR